jgi:gamma-glutamyltranspeptidase/glutathione hydrolase
VAVLKSGGNAVDAAVAVGFALAVTFPYAGNLGGGGFMLIRMADGRTAFIDFREKAPRKAAHDMYLDASGNATKDSVLGWRAAGVPGTVRGLDLALKKYGTKPWAELLRPAIRLASSGFPISYPQMRSFKSNADGLSQFSESKRSRSWLARLNASRDTAPRNSMKARPRTSWRAKWRKTAD